MDTLLLVESAPLEELRAAHETRQRLLVTMASLQSESRKNKRERINAEHEVAQMLAEYRAASQTILRLSRAREALVAREAARLAAPGAFASFLKSVDALRAGRHDVQRAFATPTERFAERRAAAEERIKGHPIAFSDEEGYGRYVDLSALHLAFGNLPHNKAGDAKVSYVDFVSQFARLIRDAPPAERRAPAFAAFLRAAEAYLSDFATRAKPLLDLRKELSAAENALDAADPMQSGEDALELETFVSASQLEALGRARLVLALARRGLKRGGTLEELAARLFAAKGKALSEIDSRALAKSHQQPAAVREVARCEARVLRLHALLANEFSSARDATLRRQAMTAEQRKNDQQNEDEEASDGDVGESEDEASRGSARDLALAADEALIYNPKNLPMGPDGKPIPYWLYKLHGLNIKFACEICGNHNYLGPKDFIRHFAEWRHAHGMRCLGIANTAHFAFVTRIEDALAIWDKLRNQRSASAWAADREEFEDTNANVVTRQMYNDLYGAQGGFI